MPTCATDAKITNDGNDLASIFIFFTKDLLHHISYWLLPIWCKILWHTFEVFNLNKLSQKTLYIEKLTGIILSRMSLVWTICYRLQNIDFMILSSECWLQDISLRRWDQNIDLSTFAPGHWFQDIDIRLLNAGHWLPSVDSRPVNPRQLVNIDISSFTQVYWSQDIYSRTLIQRLKSECWLQDIDFRTLTSGHCLQDIDFRTITSGHWLQDIDSTLT